MTSYKNNSSRVDYGLVLILFLMFLTSCITIYSAQGQYSGNFALRQVIYYAIGCGIIAFVIRLDSDQLKRLTWYAYAFGVFLLALLIIAPESIAPRINGAKAWFRLPGFSLQPSEFTKVFIILALARVILEHHQKNPLKTIRSDFWLLIKIGFVTGLPLLLVIKEDLGTSLVIISIMLGMIFIAGISWKILLPIFGSGAALVSGIFYLVIARPDILEKYVGVEQYKLNRIYSWIDPWNNQSSTGFQLVKSLLAIGSGQTSGKGLFGREVVIPEGHTDFIFSVIGEEFGFVGASVVISLFFLLIYHITKIAIQAKNDYYTYICVGIISMITFHVFQNVGMTIGLLPITGIPLPFISYGGSSLMGGMLAMGLIFSIRYHHKKYMFSKGA
ncbi:FtsW/RodA/SpoVE family cell cycle protein [Bacillus massilinigeriensis]|uniref:FtsW/RodA/SpoVE family cell cycle protein n=1 Tax=Bacillus mediterraneensis TaxID=1805474 RepID=UPI0008F94527|nr:FtsW/RodA/SpoVE family cell cycle protein [Bacillus mediterraneensis]